MAEDFISYEKIEVTLACLDSPYCTLSKSERELAQEKNCIWCTRVYEDVNGVAEITEPYFEGDDE